MTSLRQLGNWALSTDREPPLRDRLHGPLLRLQRLLGPVPPVHLLDVPGFEVETLVNVRVAKAGLKTTEVPSFEAERIHGESHLNTFRDGFRVLRTMIRELPVLTGAERPVATGVPGVPASSSAHERLASGR